jgi:hypothetical protein
MKNCDKLLGNALPVVPSSGHARKGTASPAMFTTTVLVIWKLLLPLLVLIAIIDWFTASDDRRIRVLARTGRSQRQIAASLNITRYRVRRALAS